jgi:hypothetical protein
MALFRSHFPEATGTATLSADRRGALIALLDSAGIGLLQSHGQRWNARTLQPGDVANVRMSDDNTLRIELTDYAGPRASLVLANADERAAWLVRLQALTKQASSSPTDERFSRA